jgi:hypothetical protein
MIAAEAMDGERCFAAHSCVTIVLVGSPARHLAPQVNGFLGFAVEISAASTRDVTPHSTPPAATHPAGFFCRLDSQSPTVCHAAAIFMVKLTQTRLTGRRGRPRSVKLGGGGRVLAIPCKPPGFRSWLAAPRFAI